MEIELYSSSDNFKLYKGSMLDLSNVIASESIDSIVTDPPYELNFMGKGWDNSGIAFQKDTWEKCFDVLKPGGYLLAFGGSRTFHRIAVAIEDAGFEIRDTIMWIYGSGFPKSMNIGLAIDEKNQVDNRTNRLLTNGVHSISGSGCYNLNNGKGNPLKTTYEERKAQNEWAGWGTALKPAYEPIIVARKPCKGSCIDNVIKYGVGGLNIDECRIGDEEIKTNGKVNNTLFFKKEHEALDTVHNGRFPANVILTYDETDQEEVCGGMPETKNNLSFEPDNRKVDDASMFFGGGRSPLNSYGDEGNAARYFYCAKASKRDRDEGLDAFETKTKVFNGNSAASSKDIKDVEQLFTTRMKNIHPTVKPTDLMQYLVRLVTPKGGTVLDPFNGSGSTGKAVMFENHDRQANYHYIGIEITAEYLPIADARIRYAEFNNIPLGVPEKPLEGQLSIDDLFGGVI